jgi:hypothetical protein
MANTLWDPNIGNIVNPNFGTLTAGTFTVGAVTDKASGIVGKTDYFQRLSLPVTAVTNTDYTMSVPAGATIIWIAVYTTTAYTGTTANISIGNAAAGAQYVVATSIASIGIVQLTLVNAAAAALLSMPAGTPNLFIRIAQSTTPTAVGAGTLVVNYTQA